MGVELEPCRAYLYYGIGAPLRGYRHSTRPHLQVGARGREKAEEVRARLERVCSCVDCEAFIHVNERSGGCGSQMYTCAATPRAVRRPPQ
jgi:hypothetical protein